MAFRILLILISKTSFLSFRTKKTYFARIVSKKLPAWILLFQRFSTIEMKKRLLARSSSQFITFSHVPFMPFLILLPFKSALHRIICSTCVKITQTTSCCRYIKPWWYTKTFCVLDNIILWQAWFKNGLQNVCDHLWAFCDTCLIYKTMNVWMNVELWKSHIVCHNELSHHKNKLSSSQLESGPPQRVRDVARIGQIWGNATGGPEANEKAFFPFDVANKVAGYCQETWDSVNREITLHTCATNHVPWLFATVFLWLGCNFGNILVWKSHIIIIVIFMDRMITFLWNWMDYYHQPVMVVEAKTFTVNTAFMGKTVFLYYKFYS